MEKTVTPANYHNVL